MFFKDIEGKLILADLSEDFIVKEKLIGTEDFIFLFCKNVYNPIFDTEEFIFTEISENIFNELKLKGIKHKKNMKY